MAYKPPYTVSEDMLNTVKNIIRLIGRVEGYQLLSGNLKLRRINKIKSLHSSLAIEGNQLTREQVTAVVNGDRIIGPAKDILEVENAITVYDKLETIDAFSEDDLLTIHGDLMRGLVSDAGKYRQGSVGVLDGTTVIHLGPPAHRVPQLMGQLFEYLTQTPEDIIIKSCVFHYEFEFIHPFSDGNGRMGRLWQTAILKSEYPDLSAVPLESIIHDRQQGYYDALLASQRAASSDPFIEFALAALETALEEQLAQVIGVPQDPESRLIAFRKQIKTESFSRKDYHVFHKQISGATATRDLKKGVDKGAIVAEGEMRNRRYRFVVSN